MPVTYSRRAKVTSQVSQGMAVTDLLVQIVHCSGLIEVQTLVV